MQLSSLLIPSWLLFPYLLHSVSMTYVALLRGINVGGNNKVEMKVLKQTFEKLGLSDVKTYINSGNVIFHDDRSPTRLIPLLERAIEAEFGFSVKVLLRSLRQMKAVAKELPKDWTKDSPMSCDVLFLWEEFDSPQTLELLAVHPSVDKVKYVDGAIIWMIDRNNYTKSGLPKVIGTKLYKNMTIRNYNTTVKLLTLMNESSR